MKPLQEHRSFFPRATANKSPCHSISQSATPITTSEPVTRWLTAAQILLYSAALPNLWPLVHKRLNNEVVARAYIDQLGQRPGRHYTQPHQLEPSHAMPRRKKQAANK